MRGSHEPLPDQTSRESSKLDDDNSSESDDDSELPRLQFSRVLRRIIIEDFYKSGFTVARMLKSMFSLAPPSVLWDDGRNYISSELRSICEQEATPKYRIPSRKNIENLVPAVHRRERLAEKSFEALELLAHRNPQQVFM